MTRGITKHMVRPAVAIAMAAVVPLPGAEPDAEKVEFFERRVRPILVESCYTCHSAETKPSGGLRVDDRNGLLSGGNSGPAVVPGDPAGSLLLQRLQHVDPKKIMPKEGAKLADSEIEALTKWVQDGAEWPRERIPASLAKPNQEFEKMRKTHWAWQPLSSPAPPQTRDAQWPVDGVDRFVLAKLEENQLQPAGDVDRATLIRRVTFDLTGLPPSPREIRDFVVDRDSDDVALAKVVDRLLQSPDFGIAWGRHWLDVARYGESTGPSRNIPYPHAWKYRDYVVDAINRDIPFDRFIEEQIAGDLLPSKAQAERDRLLTATGFLALGVKDVNQRFKVRFIMDNVDEQIDAVSRSVLALTVSCARCHDHKFDPVPMTDYYALAGIFTSTENAAGVRNKMGGGGLDYYDPVNLVRLSSKVPQAPAEEVTKLETQVAEAKKAWEEIRGTPEGLKKDAEGKPVQRGYRMRFEKLQSDLLDLTDPALKGGAVHGVRDSSRAADTEVRIRGEAERLGPTVERGFLSTFDVPDAPSINPAQSGRLELAQWLASERNPLTARVYVNRVWHHLFGQGIVSTVDNFGVNGAAPSHPELLDYLAGRFMAEGWSLKKLVRGLVLTRTYRQGTGESAAHREIDPANRLLWQHSPRRLTTEELRDAMLTAAGQLLQAPADAPVSQLRMVEIRDNGPEAARMLAAADQSRERSLYLPLLRGIAARPLEAFDPVEQTLVTGQRSTTTVPAQALYLMNGAFVRRQSLALARVLLEMPAEDRLLQAWLLTLGREPRNGEYKRAARFIAETAEAFAPATVTPVAVPAVMLAEGKGEVITPVNSDDVDRTDATLPEADVQPTDPKTAAWMALTQALYTAAEFRFVR